MDSFRELVLFFQLPSWGSNLGCQALHSKSFYVLSHLNDPKEKHSNWFELVKRYMVNPIRDDGGLVQSLAEAVKGCRRGDCLIEVPGLGNVGVPIEGERQV